MPDNSLKYRFLEFINHHQLLTSGQKILVAVSGGVDSMVLLHLLWTWQQYFRLELGVVHYNHQLREAAGEDETLVRRTAAEYRLPVWVGRGDVRQFAREKGYSLEEAGRLLRERFWDGCREGEGYAAVATGHNLNDQTETVLMRLLSGAGPEGLAGIRLRRPGYIRPLLFADRSQIAPYAAAHRLTYREDLSNRDLRFLRNRIRHRLIPFLEEEFAVFHPDSFLNLALILQDWLPQLAEQSEQAFEKAARKAGQNKIRLDIAAYRRYFSGIQIKLLEKILSQLLKEPLKLTFKRFQSFSNWLDKPAGSGSFLLDSRVVVHREDSALAFERLSESPQPKQVFEKLVPPARYDDPEWGLALRVELVSAEAVQFDLNRQVEFLDAHHLTFPLILRNWRPGDRFQPLGMAQQKKLSDFLTDDKELPLPKSRALVLESRGDIICVPGGRISETYKVSAQSQKILKVELQIT